MLKWNSRHMTSFAEETTSASKCLFHEQLSMDLARVQRPTRWTVAFFRAHTHESIIRHLWRSYKRLLRQRHRFCPGFLYTDRHEPFFRVCQIVWEQIFFTASCSCNIECMLIEEEMPKDVSISRYVTWRSCIISSCTASMFSDTKAVFGRPSRT